jgi:hypothetical protein
MLYIGGMHMAYTVHSQTIFRQIVTISLQTRLVIYLIFVFIPAFFKTRKCNTNLSSISQKQRQIISFMDKLLLKDCLYGARDQPTKSCLNHEHKYAASAGWPTLNTIRTNRWEKLYNPVPCSEKSCPRLQCLYPAEDSLPDLTKIIWLTDPISWNPRFLPRTTCFCLAFYFS